MAFAQLVEIVEKFFDSHAFHHYCGADPLLNVAGVAGDVNARLQVAVSNHVNFGCGSAVEAAQLLGRDTLGVDRGRHWVLRDISREDVLRAIEVLAELEVVDFSLGAKVAVTADDQVKHSCARGHQAKAFENA